MRANLIIFIPIIACILVNKFDYLIVKETESGKKNIASISDDTIQPPFIYSPAYGSSISGDSCTFVWSSTGRKHVYEIMITKNPGYSEGVRYSSKDTTITLSSSELPSNLTYYWKVRAFKSKHIFSKWSPYSFFFFGVTPINIGSGCNRDCANCKHPCGRRRIINYEIEKVE